jgi:hypothetical protein
MSSRAFGQPARVKNNPDFPSDRPSVFHLGFSPSGLQMAFRRPSPAQIVCTIAFKLLQMMGNRLLMGICVGGGLRGERRGLFSGFHTSTRDDHPSNVNDFKAFLFAVLKPALA